MSYTEERTCELCEVTYTREALNRVIDYVYDEEHKNWEEAGKPQRDHIFTDIKLVSEWYNSNPV